MLERERERFEVWNKAGYCDSGVKRQQEDEDRSVKLMNRTNKCVV